MIKPYFAIVLVFFVSTVSIAQSSQIESVQSGTIDTQVFPSKNTPIDPVNYRTIEECLAFGARLKFWTSRSSYRDTLPLIREELWNPIPDSVRNGVARCVSNFQLDAAPLKDWFLLLRAFLLAGHENDARAIVARRLNAIGATNDQERASVLDSVIYFYKQEQPPRFSAIDTIYQLLLTLPDSVFSKKDRLRVTADILWTAKEYQDTLRTRQYAERVRHMNQILTDDERNSISSTWLNGHVFGSIRELNRAAALDSLRKGSITGYLDLIRKAWNEASGGSPMDTSMFPWGRKASPLQGKVFRSAIDTSTQPRPTPGKVALVVFIHADEYGDIRVWNIVSTLKRLHKRFPDLEINLVADHPPAYFGTAPALDSATEADLWRKWIMEFHQFPGSLIVERSQLYLIPNVEDRRRVVLRAYNPLAYRGGLATPGAPLVPGEGFLVDRSGTIVQWVSQGVNRTTEAELAEEIELLLAHPVK